MSVYCVWSVHRVLCVLCATWSVCTVCGVCYVERVYCVYIRVEWMIYMYTCLVYREYLLEVKVRLLEQLSCGFNSPQLAIEFIQMLLDEYSALCNALPALLYLLAPLVSSAPLHTVRFAAQSIFTIKYCF